MQSANAQSAPRTQRAARQAIVAHGLGGTDRDHGHSSEVATAIREALSQVVDAGTAKRVAGTFKLADGTPLAMGGKTGTGDNRIEAIGSGGRILSSKSLNRTATFVFYIGDNHFGSLTAFVPGRSAESFTFSSALPVQVLKGMAPILNPYLQPGSHTQCLPVDVVRR